MKITIDTDEQVLITEAHGSATRFDLYSDEAFHLLAEWWLKVGWNQKYVYTFSWMGRPIIQLPEDMIRIQEVLYHLRPDVIIETGIAHGGSLIFYASLCALLGSGRVIGVDIEIRPHNRLAIENHQLFPFITMIEGNSIDSIIVNQVRSLIQPGERVLVILDSNHSYDHVLGELEAYAPMVTSGSYIVATDGIMQSLTDVPRGKVDWFHNNPVKAVETFLKQHQEFICETPQWSFNESTLSTNITHWPNAWLKRS